MMHGTMNIKFMNIKSVSLVHEFSDSWILTFMLLGNHFYWSWQ